MSAGFVPPDSWTEISGQLRTSGSCVLSALGFGTITFQPTSANQRWVVSSVVVSTNQPSLATVIPYCTPALNTTDYTQMSQGNQWGTSWTGNNDTFSGDADVGQCDFLGVLFYPPPGATLAQVALLAGVTCTAIVSGTRYTRRR